MRCFDACSYIDDYILLCVAQNDTAFMNNIHKGIAKSSNKVQNERIGFSSSLPQHPET